MTKVVEIGGELEQQKLAMKAILGDEGMANTISSQINTLAVKSPFGVMELNQYAKQLTAFQIPYNELYDTMKRMADVSAAVGVDMGRIILAYGQVRAAKFLKGTELRQFTEANIPLIDMLAERFTKLKGEIVSAGDIMDMISNKEVPFEDVKAVLWELTGEGGRFYNMQEVLSESVKAKWKNLADAIDLMFADIADFTSGPLKTTAELLTSLTENWKKLATVIGMVAVAYGMHKAAMLVTNKVLAYNTTLTNLNSRAISANLSRWKLFQREMGKGWTGLKKNIKSFFSDTRNLVGVATGAVSAALTALVLLWESNNEEMQEAKRLGDDLFTKATEGARNLGEALRSLQGDFSKLDEVALQSSVSKMEQLIKDYSPEADKILFESYSDENGMRRTSQQRAEYLRNYVEEMQSAYDMMKNLDLGGKLFDAIDAEDGYWYTGSWFNDNLKTDIADFSDHWRNFDKEITDFATKYPNDVETIVKAAQRESDEFKNATDGMKTYSEMFRILLQDTRFDNLAEHLSPKTYISNKAQYGWDDIFTEKGDMERATKEVENEMQGVIERIKNSLDWDFTDLQDEQKMALSLMGNKLFEEIDNLAPEAQRRVKQLWESAFGIEFDESRARGLILEAFQKELAKTEPELAKQIKNGKELDEAALKRVDEIFVKVKKSLIAKFGPLRGIIEKLIGATGKNGETKVNADFRVNVIAQLDETKDLANWQKTLVQKLGEDTLQELDITVKGHSDLDSFIDAARKGHKAAKESMKELGPMIMEAGISFNMGKPIDKLPLKLKDGSSPKDNPLLLAAIDRYNALAIADSQFYEVMKANGIDLDVDPNKSQRTPKDKFAESLKQRFKDIKDAWSEFQKWSKTEGREAAATRIGESGLFSTLSADKIPQTVEQYRALVVELENELRKAGVKGTAREGLLNDLLKQLLDIDKAVVDEQLKLALDKVSKEAERQLADWNLFDKIRRATGNQDLAMSIAFGMNADATTDYPKLVKEQFAAVAKAAGHDLTFDNTTLEQAKALGDDIAKAYQDTADKLTKYAREQKDAIADILNEYQSLQDKLTKIDGKRQQDLDIVNRSNLGEPEKAVLRQRINVEADYKKFTQSNEYLQFFAGIYALTEQEATRIGDLIEQHLNRQLQAGAISAEDYYKEIERIRQQLDKLRNVKSDALTFATGGVKGINDKRKETNAAERLETIQKIATLEDKLQKAREAGDIHQEVLLMAQLRGAKEELSLQDKIRDKIIQNEQQWQKVLDVANAASNIAGGLSDAFNSIKDMADAFGADVDSGAWADITAVMDTLTAVTSGVQKVVQSAMNGDVGGIISGAVATITTPFTIWAQLHDKKLQKMIERSKEYSQQLQYINDAIERRMGSFLGNAKYLNTERMEQDRAKAKETEAMAQRVSHLKGGFLAKKIKEKSRKENEKYQARVKAMDEGGAYGYQRQLMTEQLAELEKQRQAELDKKKTDKSVVADYDDQIDELTMKIQEFAMETAKDLYGIDVKQWASELGDALFDAWKKGEDGAEAFKRKAGEILGDVMNSVLKIGMLEPMMQDVSDYLFGTEEERKKNGGKGGVFGTDFKLSPDDISGLAAKLMKGMEGVDAYNSALDQLEKILNEKYGLSMKGDEESKSGLSAGIQSITEDTADLLASYVNAIRASVAMNEGRWERLLNDSIPQMNIVAEAQLAAQRQIAENTLRNAVAAEAIVKSNDEINRLLTRATQGGAKFYIH